MKGCRGRDGYGAGGSLRLVRRALHPGECAPAVPRDQYRSSHVPIQTCTGNPSRRYPFPRPVYSRRCGAVPPGGRDEHLSWVRRRRYTQPYGGPARGHSADMSRRRAGTGYSRAITQYSVLSSRAHFTSRSTLLRNFPFYATPMLYYLQFSSVSIP